MIPSTVEKIVEIDEHIACATSGLMADSRTLIERARVEAQQHWFLYNEKISVEGCARCVAELAIQFGDSDSETVMSRPFGVAMLYAGISVDPADETRLIPQLWHMDPSGTYIEFLAKAIGAGSEGAQQRLQDHYIPERKPSNEEAVEKALEILKEIMEKPLDSSNVEVMVMKIDDESKKSGRYFNILSKDELEGYIKKLPATIQQ